ncbi:MAG: radical SAM protein [Nitrospiria bacterium]
MMAEIAVKEEFKPFLIAWNLTKRCNLKCEHCYLSAGERDAGSIDELKTEECFKTIDEMVKVNPASILVLTGGEPLLRRDLPQLARYASQKGNPFNGRKGPRTEKKRRDGGIDQRRFLESRES